MAFLNLNNLDVPADNDTNGLLNTSNNANGLLNANGLSNANILSSYALQKAYGNSDSLYEGTNNNLSFISANADKPTGPANAASTNPNLGGTNVSLNPDREKAINDMYEANINAQTTKLQEAGEQALSDAQANRDKIAGIYDKQRNAASVDWERQRRNFLEGAATSGLNTGAGSQAELHMMGSQQRTQNTLGAAQAQAEVEADRNIADIARTTQAAINEAIQENDYKKAAALLDEYNAEYSRQMDRASALAQYGDFSGYASIYGEETAKQMFYNWAAQKPQLAYTMGAITTDQYINLISGLSLNNGLDENGVRTTPLIDLNAIKAQMDMYGSGGGGGGGGSSGHNYDDPWGYGGSGWNYSGGGGSSDSGDSGGGSSALASFYSDHADEMIQGIIDRNDSVVHAALNR